MTKTTALFLCTGNSSRSQMAEAFLRAYAGDRFDVFSAGLEPHGVNPYTVRVMAEIGLDLSGHYSKSIDELMGSVEPDYLITVCAGAEANCPAIPSVSNRLHWAFDDPAAFVGSDEDTLRVFRQVRDQIEQRVRIWLDPMSGAVR